MTPETHPLDNDRLYDEFNGYDPGDLKDFLAGSSFIFEAADMRAAYDSGRDEQLEQDQKELEDFLEQFLCCGHGHEANSDLRIFVHNFKSDMRPTQENNS